MLAVSAGALGVGASLAQVVDSVSGDNRKPTPILLLPVDGGVATALRSDIEEPWLSSTPAGRRRGCGRQSETAAGHVDDASYRYKRQRNNEAARRSREKRRQQDGVIRHQLEALIVENRELRFQLALFRRLLDDVAAGTLASAQHKDVVSGGGGALQPGWSSLSSISSVTALSTASDQSHRDNVMEESSTDDVTSVGGKPNRKDVRWTDASDSADWEHHQLVTPLNLSQRIASS